jgi:DNA-directed RNA polymerase subunit RPC12/RpoP
MKVCPECKSDMLEETSSTALRVVACIVLLFIPFGIFFCWIPFVFPRNYACKNCGADVPTPEELDWREIDEKKQEYKEIKENKQSMVEEKEVQVYKVDDDDAINKEK